MAHVDPAIEKPANTGVQQARNGTKRVCQTLTVGII